MPPNEVRVLERWTVSPGFSSQSVAEAALGLAQLLPHHPQPDDHPLEICHEGYRWFRQEMEAVADAIHREARRPDATTKPLTGAAWARRRNRSGLWAIPGLPRTLGSDLQHLMVPK